MKDPSTIQKEAINHLFGPAQVIAGPGSGKTFTIIQRVMHLVNKQSIPAENILVISYTKASAEEMEARYRSATHKDHLRFGTFHSICYQILTQNSNFSSKSLISENEKRTIINHVLHNQGLANKSNYDSITELLNQISRNKNISVNSNLKNSEHYFSVNEFTQDEFLIIWSEYEELLKEQLRLDFDDMILKCLNLLKENPHIRHKYQSIFQFILVDEFQDINPPQYEVLNLLIGQTQNLFVVGDDDQAIYGFRGATPHIMQQFMKDYPEAKQYLLTENYRCGECIVHLADHMISKNQNRFMKQFKAIILGGKINCMGFNSRIEEEEALIEALNSLNKDLYVKTAIILRTNREALQYKELLKKNSLPVRELIQSENHMVKGFILEDMSAFLAYLYEGKCRSHFIQFMNKPNRYLSRMALPSEKVNLLQMQKYYENNNSMMKTLSELINNLTVAEGLTPNLAVMFFRKVLGYDSYLKSRASSQAEELYFIRQAEKFQELVKDYSVGSGITDYLSQIMNQNKQESHVLQYSSGIYVITMHGAKGLEFENVFLPDVNEGIIPGKKCLTTEDFEEERRLLYVAITRAKTNLCIYYTNERNRKVSRYLNDIIDLPFHQNLSIRHIP